MKNMCYFHAFNCHIYHIFMYQRWIKIEFTCSSCSYFHACLHIICSLLCVYLGKKIKLLIDKVAEFLNLLSNTVTVMLRRITHVIFVSNAKAFICISCSANNVRLHRSSELVQYCSTNSSSYHANISTNNDEGWTNVRARCC